MERWITNINLTSPDGTRKLLPFRWDYIWRFSARSGRDFPGFKEFIRRGVKSEYVQSVFPSEDFPSWQTINTGLYPGSHGIIGNQFFDPDSTSRSGSFFDAEDERATSEMKWWSTAEPIWATAHKSGLKFTMLLWARCDIPWFDMRKIRPQECESFYEKDESKSLPILLDLALIDFQKGNDAAIIYENSLAKTGEEYGPLSVKVEQRLRMIDRDIQFLLKRLREVHMERNVNVIIMSDHGMAYSFPPNYRFHPRSFPIETYNISTVHMGEALAGVSNLVKMVVGSGAYSMIYPRRKWNNRDVDKIVTVLRRTVPGADVFTRDELPEHLHWQHERYTPPILVLAHPGTVLLRAGSNLQRPASQEHVHGGSYEATTLLAQTKQGITGYDPMTEDMRGVFMAMGPGFFSGGQVHDAIELVDVYQLMCFLLNIEPRPNDGEWSRVRPMLRNAALTTHSSLMIALVLWSSTVTWFTFGAR